MSRGHSGATLAEKNMDAWHQRCQRWAKETDGSIYSSFYNCAPPSKDFMQIYITADQVVLRVFPMIPPVRSSNAKPPKDHACTHGDFLLEDEIIRGKVSVVVKPEEMHHIDRILAGHFDFICRLPEYLIVRILRFLDIPSLCNMARTCKFIKELCDSDKIWSKLFARRVTRKMATEDQFLIEAVGWKGAYKFYTLNQPETIRQIRTDKDSDETVAGSSNSKTKMSVKGLPERE